MPERTDFEPPADEGTRAPRDASSEREAAPGASPFEREDPSEGAFPDDLAAGDASEEHRDDEAAAAFEDAREPSRYNPTLVTVFIGLLCLACVGYALFGLSDEESAGRVGGAQPGESAPAGEQRSERPLGASEADAERLNPDAFHRRETAASARGAQAGEEGAAGSSWKPAPASGPEDVSRALSAGRTEVPRNPFTDPPRRGPRVGPGGSGEPTRADKIQKERESKLAEALASPTSLSFGAPFGRAGGGAGSSAAPLERPYGSPEAPDRAVRGRALQERYERATAAPPGSPFEKKRSAAGIGGASGGAAYSAEGAGMSRERRARLDNQRFLQRIEQEGGGPANVSEVHGPLPPFTLPRGTIVPIALESAVNSQLGGQIAARVTADVKDPTKEHVLIPAGARIVSDYGAPSAVGQSRLLVAATRMNLPDGRYVNFRSARATDPLGRAGMEDQTDRHFLSRFGAVGALAVLGAAVNASAGPARFGQRLPRAPRDSSSGGGDVVIYPPGAGYGYGGYDFGGAVGRSFAQEINQVLGKILDRQIDRAPTIKLRPGLEGQLLLGEDLDMKHPYYEGGSGYGRLRLRQEAALLRMRRQRRPSQTGGGVLPAQAGGSGWHRP